MCLSVRVNDNRLLSLDKAFQKYIFLNLTFVKFSTLCNWKKKRETLTV